MSFKNNKYRKSNHADLKIDKKGPSDQVTIIGRNALTEVLRASPERIRQVQSCVTESGDHSADAKELLRTLRNAGVTVQESTRTALDTLAGSTTHQGFLATLSPRTPTDLREFIESHAGVNQCLILLLDSIADPQNLGTILRAAECFGVDAVVLSTNRGTSLTPAARKASVGASELVEIIEVGNMSQALGKLKEANFWSVAADGSPDAADVNRFEFPARCVLMMGAEGEGLHQLLKNQADFTVKIPMLGRIDSLNVSQATAILLHSYRRVVSNFAR